MIHLIGFILMIIGWILLGILGIILGILLFVLFSAIRYQIDGEKRESLTGQVKITWLLWILSIQIRYQEGLSVRAAIFGRTIWQMGQPPDREKEKADLGKAGEWPEELLEEKDVWPEELLEEKDVWQEELLEEKEEQQGDLPEGEEDPQTESRGEKKGFRKGKKIRFSFSSFCDKLKQGKDKLSALQERWESLRTFLADPDNQASGKLILRQTKKIFIYLFPRKGRAEITFGLEDPYLMGKALSLAALAYPFTHQVIILHPVFDQKLLEGEAHVRGHIRLGVLGGYVLRLLFDRNIRRRLWKLICRK